MSFSAEQYRALVNKLESINNSDQLDEAGNFPTFSGKTKEEAIANATKKLGPGKKFYWCRTFKVQAAKKVKQSAKPAPGKVDFLGQQTPLGGDAQNPMSFASNSNFGA